MDFTLIAGNDRTHWCKSSVSIKVRRPRFTARKAPDWIASYIDVRPAHAIAHASGTL